MQTSGGDTASLELMHLVLHQGDQRGHHHHETLPDKGRQLEAERLAGSSGQHRQTVASLQQGLHHRALTGSESIPAEVPLQHRRERIGRQGSAPLIVYVHPNATSDGVQGRSRSV